MLLNCRTLAAIVAVVTIACGGLSIENIGATHQRTSQAAALRARDASDQHQADQIRRAANDAVALQE